MLTTAPWPGVSVAGELGFFGDNGGLFAAIEMATALVQNVGSTKRQTSELHQRDFAVTVACVEDARRCNFFNTFERPGHHEKICKVY